MRKIILVSLVVIGLMSCGTATNNDQGNSFTAYGWAAPDNQGVCTFGLVNTASVLLSTGAIFLETLSSGELVLAPGLCFVIGTNLTKQTIRADRMYYKFRIPGASEQPPTTSAPFSVVLSPPQEGQGDGDGPKAQSVSMGGRVLPNEIIQWINLNRAKLPQLPFRLEGIYTVSGVTGAGDRMETNEISFNFTVIEDNIILPGGSGGGGSTGGGGSATGSSDNGNDSSSETDGQGSGGDAL